MPPESANAFKTSFDLFLFAENQKDGLACVIAIGLDDILIQGDDLHILINQPVKVNLRSIDVLHDFYIPQFRAKMDMVPGVVTYYWFTPIRTGNFEILCMEYCGTGHYAMRGRVLVDEQKDYEEWLSEQMTFEEMMASIDKTDLIQIALNNKGDK